MDFWLQSEDLPRPDNRIYYDGERVMLDIKEDTNMEAAPPAARSWKEMLTPTPRTGR